MDQSKQREIASKGGQAAHKKGTAHEFTSDEARAAGRKGGEAVSADRAHMSAIGRKGGESSHTGRKSAQNKVAPDSESIAPGTDNDDQSSDSPTNPDGADEDGRIPQSRPLSWRVGCLVGVEWQSP